MLLQARTLIEVLTLLQWWAAVPLSLKKLWIGDSSERTSRYVSKSVSQILSVRWSWRAGLWKSGSRWSIKAIIRMGTLKNTVSFKKALKNVQARDRSPDTKCTLIVKSRFIKVERTLRYQSYYRRQLKEYSLAQEFGPGLGKAVEESAGTWPCPRYCT